MGNISQIIANMGFGIPFPKFPFDFTHWLQPGTLFGCPTTILTMCHVVYLKHCMYNQAYCVYQKTRYVTLHKIYLHNAYIYSYYDIKFQAPFSPNMALSNKCPTLQTWIRDAEHFVPDRVFEKQPRFRANPGFTADLKGRWWFGACLVFFSKLWCPFYIRSCSGKMVAPLKFDMFNSRESQKEKRMSSFPTMAFRGICS